MTNICVFCSSSEVVEKVYFEEAIKLGQFIGENKFTLVHGGGKIGLMGATARSTQQNGGKVIGIIPERLRINGVVSETDDELIITENMHFRKDEMRKRADAFITLPGGFGTLEEILEVITLKQLRYHSKPIVFINTNGFYDDLFNQFEKSYIENFAKPGYRNLYYVAKDSADAMEYLKSYTYTLVQDKWFDKTE